MKIVDFQFAFPVNNLRVASQSDQPTPEELNEDNENMTLAGESAGLEYIFQKTKD
ncbi:MAG: hypothetical protein HY094_08570 [Candidatus Melainabacteria bacterium]|nr:hypothetical protein [Candidatus Melainabacteria bacterium]